MLPQFIKKLVNKSSKEAKKIFIILFFIFLAIIGFFIFLCNTPSTPFTRQQQAYLSSPLIQRIAHLVEKEYVDAPDLQRMNEGVLCGMLMALDPYSTYMNKENYAYFLQSANGEFGGVGLEIMHTESGIRVITPLDDTPAARAGMQPGDLITHVNDEKISGLGYGEILKKIQGKPGSQVQFTVDRSDQGPFPITLTREMITIQSVKVHQEHNIIYVRLSYFHDKTATQLQDSLVKEINASSKEPPLGIILDLRNNPGGLLDQAIAVSSLFVGKKDIVHVKTRDDRQNKTYSGSLSEIASTIPMITLINGGSASASEIVAAALQDYKRSLLMGKRTLGKGSVQTLFPLHGEGAVRLTTAKFYSPLNHEIHGKGVTPDIIVEHSESNARKSATGIAGQTPFRKNGIPCDHDPLLQQAVDMLKGMKFLSAARDA